jgi:pyridoxamine 5'-phosphate oxidase
MAFDLQQLRREFTSKGITRSELDDNPFVQFEHWMNEAISANITLPNAMSLATSNETEVSLRTVLLKSFNERGFVFFTNYHSKKAQQIDENPKAGLLFPWLDLERQVKISGIIEKVSLTESLNYFISRPKDSQLGAWTSKQSSSLSSRQVLLTQFESMKAKFKNNKIPLPDFWGGYRLKPQSIEFWQGRENRLHDRFRYQQQKNTWVLTRLAP